MGGLASLQMVMTIQRRRSLTAQCDNSKKALDDCLNPACHSTMDLLKKFNLKKKKKPVGIEKEKGTENPYCTGCPVDKDQLV